MKICFTFRNNKKFIIEELQCGVCTTVLFILFEQVVNSKGDKASTVEDPKTLPWFHKILNNSTIIIPGEEQASNFFLNH